VVRSMPISRSEKKSRSRFHGCWKEEKGAELENSGKEKQKSFDPPLSQGMNKSN